MEADFIETKYHYVTMIDLSLTVVARLALNS